jgi:hypothetical protein
MDAVLIRDRLPLLECALLIRRIGKLKKSASRISCELAGPFIERYAIHASGSANQLITRRIVDVYIGAVAEVLVGVEGTGLGEYEGVNAKDFHDYLLANFRGASPGAPDEDGGYQE